MAHNYYHAATHKRAKIGDEVRHGGSRGVIASLPPAGHFGARVAIEWGDGSVTPRVLASECGLFHSSADPSPRGYWNSYLDGIEIAGNVARGLYKGGEEPANPYGRNGDTIEARAWDHGFATAWAHKESVTAE